MKRVLQMCLLLVPALLLAQTRTGTIDGRIVLANGDPAVGVRVAAVAMPESAATGVGATTLLSLTRSDATGHYRLEDVPAGRYLITAGTLDTPTYYPGVSTAAEASTVVVPQGGTVAAINFSVPPMPPKVSGRLKMLRQDRTAGVAVSLYGAGVGVRLETTTKSDGSFQFDAVRPGAYMVELANRMLATTMTISVTDKDITGLEIPLLDNVFIGGSLVVDGSGLRPRITLSFASHDPYVCSWLRVPFEDSRDGAGGCSVPVPFQASGLLRSLVEGDYRVSVSALPPGYFLKSVVSGDVDLLSQPLHVGSAQPIVVTIGVDAPLPLVKVSGHLRDKSHFSWFPKPNRLSLLPDPAYASPLADFLDPLEAAIQDDGSFEFPLVPPGTYELTPKLPYQDLPIQSIALTVTDKDIKDIDVVIPPLKMISGRFSIEGGSSPTAVRPLSLNFALTNTVTAETVSIEAPLNSCDQSFTVVFPQGDFIVKLTSPGFPVKAAAYGSTDMLQHPLKIAYGEPDELKVLLGQGSLSTSFGGGGCFSIPADMIPSRLSLSADLAAANCLSCPMPAYPALARAASVADTVELAVVIAHYGTVQEVDFVRGNGLLKEMAMDAVEQWLYKPHLVNGKPVIVQTTVTVTFR